jgi:single-strand DNA-binding protein
MILVGHLGRDPEVRHTQSNQKIVHLAVATSERWKDRPSGEARADGVAPGDGSSMSTWPTSPSATCTKGSPIYLEGTLQTRKWTDQGGQERYTTDVVVHRGPAR